ncbi:MAG: NnrS family protein [Steroidobacteraceae bacterium]
MPRTAATGAGASGPSAAPARSPLLSYGFRPFFLAAALWAALALALWMAMLTLGLALPSRLDPLEWHIHEMLFGFVPAAVAGFLLTAIANWTGRAPVNGVRLALLLGLWLAGRIDALLSAFLPVGVAIVLDMAFPAALVATVAHELVAARNRRNYVMIAPVTVLAVAQLLMDLGALGGIGRLAGYGWRLGLAAIIILISVVGARIVPSFTRNWLMHRGDARLPPMPGRLDRWAQWLLATALMVWVIFPDARASAVLLLAGASLSLWRVLRWRGVATRAEPLLLILHIGYAWLVLGVAALGVASLEPALPLPAAIHALTAGAIGTMILGVMTRVSRGHTGRALAADRATVLIYALVVLAAGLRIAAALPSAAALDLLRAAAALWIGAFGLFAVRYAPLLLGPRRAG